MTELVLERKAQENKTPELAGGMIHSTPPIDEDYWAYRGTVGIGFASEDDWNTNLPYTCGAQEIFDHISHNKGDEAIADEDRVRAIELVRAAIAEDRS